MKKLDALKIKLVYVILAGIFLATFSLIGLKFLFSNLEVTQVSALASRGESSVIVYGDGGVLLGESRSVYTAGERVYVSDTSNHRVVVFNQAGKLLFTFGDKPQGDWQGMKYPYGIVVEGERIYVADAGLLRVGVYDLEGTFLSYFGEGALIKPINIAYRNETFYFTDVARQQVVVLDNEGNELLAFGHYGREGYPGEFNFPNGLAVDDFGRIYVADTNNGRIQVFNRMGTYITSWQGEAESGATLTAPMNIALDSNGNVYVADPVSNQVVVFTPEGRVSHVIRDVWEEKKAGSLKLPTGVYINDNGQLFVSDTGNRRLVIYLVN